MKCYICSKESDKFSHKYSDKVCLECDAMFVEHDIKADKLRKKYSDNHALCPKCGSEGHTTTLAGYIFDVEHPELYKDLNHCVCSNCGNHHTAHERIKKA